MHWDKFTQILPFITSLSSLLSVIVAFYAVQQARKTALTGTYFSEMAQAYSGYLRCVSEFVFRRGLEERDALAASLYRLQLVASKEIASDAQELYVFLLAWASSNPRGALEVDERLNNLGEKMREHLNQARKYGRL